MLSYLLIPLVVTLIFNIALFLVAYWRKTDRLTDGAYAISFAAIAAIALLNSTVTGSSLLLVALVFVWAARLGGFLVYRIWKSGKDKRFDAWRSNFWLLGRFWVLQAITAWVVMLPLLFALSQDNLSLPATSVIFVATWAAGLVIEAVADIQKYRFNQQLKNKGKWIAEGLWSWSRHPNYFGEIVIWASVYLTVFPVLSGWQRLVGLISPLFIAAILLFATGIPILEKQADEKWGNDKDYQAYKKRVSILIPLPPQKD